MKEWLSPSPRINSLLRRFLAVLCEIPLPRRYRQRVLERVFEAGGQNFAAQPGTVAWFIQTEIRYGGIHKLVPRVRISPFDPRSKEETARGGMTGGDRMLHHAYAKYYSHYLPQLGRSLEQGCVIVEVGILRGTGLAIWCDLFTSARVVGLDIDLGHFLQNRQELLSRGAFSRNFPEVYVFDQYCDNRGYIRRILKGDRISVAIDDGAHTISAGLLTFASILPHLADDFVYFVEDNRHIQQELARRYPQLTIELFGELTIVTPSTTVSP